MYQEHNLRLIIKLSIISMIESFFIKGETNEIRTFASWNKCWWEE